MMNYKSCYFCGRYIVNLDYLIDQYEEIGLPSEKAISQWNDPAFTFMCCGCREVYDRLEHLDLEILFKTSLSKLIKIIPSIFSRNGLIVLQQKLIEFGNSIQNFNYSYYTKTLRISLKDNYYYDISLEEIVKGYQDDLLSITLTKNQLDEMFTITSKDIIVDINKIGVRMEDGCYALCEQVKRPDSLGKIMYVHVNQKSKLIDELLREIENLAKMRRKTS